MKAWGIVKYKKNKLKESKLSQSTLPKSRKIERSELQHQQSRSTSNEFNIAVHGHQYHYEVENQCREQACQDDLIRGEQQHQQQDKAAALQIQQVEQVSFENEQPMQHEQRELALKAQQQAKRLVSASTTIITPRSELIASSLTEAITQEVLCTRKQNASQELSLLWMNSSPSIGPESLTQTTSQCMTSDRSAGSIHG